MINEKVLSEAIREYFKNLIEQGLQDIEILKCNAELQRLIEEQPKVGEWIPVNEKLPKDLERALTCDAHENIHILTHNEDAKYPFNITPDHMRLWQPIAWQPLPEPYKINISSQDIAVESSSPWKDHVIQRFTRSE